MEPYLFTGLRRYNLGFNLYENNWQFDRNMGWNTVIDTAIGTGSYYLAAGTMSHATAGLLTAGVALPGGRCSRWCCDSKYWF